MSRPFHYKKTIWTITSTILFYLQMKNLIASILLFFAVSSISFGQSSKPPLVPLPAPIGPKVVVAVHPDSSSGKTDSLLLNPADSVFVFDGELYFRGRANGREFFISQKHLLDKSDSLIVYQMFRLGNQIPAVSTPDTLSKKIPRQRCVALTKSGTRCRRWAEPNSDKCWQHQ